MWGAIIGFFTWALGKLFGGPKPQPDAQAQDQRDAADVRATQAETELNDSKAVIAAQGASNATVTAAADAAAASTRRSVSDPPSVDADPEGHWRD